MTAVTAPTTLHPWHPGRWTMPAAETDADAVIGRTLTPHELMLDIIHLVRRRGWNNSGQGTGHGPGGISETLLEIKDLMRVEVLYLGEGHPVGTGTVPDPELAETLERVGRRAFGWLADRAPAGYMFSLDGGLSLDPIPDVATDHVAPEAVVEAAADRGIEIPTELEMLATAHVNTGPWRALAKVGFTAGGPYASAEEAIEAIEVGRRALCEHLRAHGATDLADTLPRWIDVPHDY
ncbi:hypothetical protein AB0H58_32385 [Nocardia neocaledoniensis]|uniref:hypothetical protein n=1 Tax=Nocardia neocaledoniensis TaxID=236511 RepID=UPI0033CB1571